MSDILKIFEIELIEQAEHLLDEFYRDVVLSGTKPSVAEDIIAHCELLLIEYYSYHYLTDITHLTPEQLGDFLSEWYIESVDNLSMEEWNATIESLCFFFDFLLKSGRLNQEHHQALVLRCNLVSLMESEKQDAQTSTPVQLMRPVFFSEETNNSGYPLFSYAFLDEYEETYSLSHSFTTIPSPLKAEEVILQIQEICGVLPPPDNVIRITRNGNFKRQPDPNSGTEGQFPATLESLQAHCLALHRSNLVFHRWMHRYDMTENLALVYPFSVCMHCDVLLTYLLSIIERREFPIVDIRRCHRILDQMNRTLWTVRNQIAHKTNISIHLISFI